MFILSIYGEDFIKIQKTIKKIKPDPTRNYLNQVRISREEDNKILIEFTDANIAIHTVINCSGIEYKIENDFCLEIGFDSFKNINVDKNGIVSLIKEDKHYSFEHEQQKILCNIAEGKLPNIKELITKEYKEPREICLNLKQLSKFENFVKDPVLVIGGKTDIVTIKETTGEIIGVIMPVRYKYD